MCTMLVGVRMLVFANFALLNCLLHQCIVTRKQSFEIFDVRVEPVGAVGATHAQRTQGASSRVHAPWAIRAQHHMRAVQCGSRMYHIVADASRIKNVDGCYSAPISQSIAAVATAASAISCTASLGSVGGTLNSICMFTGMSLTLAMHITFRFRLPNAQTTRTLYHPCSRQSYTV